MRVPIVYGASALLAVLYAEPGAERVLELLEEPDGAISAVNWSEVAAKLAERGMQRDDISRELAAFGLDIVAFDEAQSLLAAALRPVTRPLGLSLGDRACLALAQLRGARRHRRCHVAAIAGFRDRRRALKAGGGSTCWNID